MGPVEIMAIAVVVLLVVALVLYYTITPSNTDYEELEPRVKKTLASVL